MKLLIDEDGKIRLWGKIFPWVCMACLIMVSVAFSYSLIK